MQVSIDGPAGAGKSTLARALSARLGFVNIDTGAMYRALGLLALERGLELADGAALARLAREIRIEFRQPLHPDAPQQVFCQGQDVTLAIRSPDISEAASRISAFPGVREALVAAQRELAAGQDVVMEGRDIGTVVLPAAECKIFLTASPDERARRRRLEMRRKGRVLSQDETLREIEERDFRDSHRAASPLRPADDSIRLDTTNLSFEQAVEEALRLVRRKERRTDAV